MHDDHDHIAAVFPDRVHAEAAVEDLLAIGLGSEHLGLAVRTDEPVVFEHDTEAERVRSSVATAAIGAPVGLLAGLGLAALVVPGIAVGGFLALAGVGAGWGAMLGGFLGLTLDDRANREHDRLEWTPLAPGEVLVAVCSHGRDTEVTSIMRQHHGEIRMIHTATTDATTR
jgi:hypothetical protein